MEAEGKLAEVELMDTGLAKGKAEEPEEPEELAAELI